MATWTSFYIGAKCAREGCAKEAVYLFLIGEADIPVCEEHLEIAKAELPGKYVSIKDELDIPEQKEEVVVQLTRKQMLRNKNKLKKAKGR